MMFWSDYHLAANVNEALQILAEAPGPARLIAGGTDLLLELQQGRQHPVHTLVDISRIAELTVIEIRGEALFIGAAATHQQIATSRLIAEHAQALQTACGLIGGPQIRYVATLGGNVAHALPAADGAIALLALDARAEVVSRQERRIVPLITLYRGPGQSSLAQTSELLAGFYLPLRRLAQGSAFHRIMRPQGVALPILNMACWIERRGDRLHDLRLAVGPAGPIPFRAHQVEADLRGQQFSTMLLEKALQGLRSSAQFRASPYRASAGYRWQLAGVLLAQVIPAAWQNAYETDS